MGLDMLIRQAQLTLKHASCRSALGHGSKQLFSVRHLVGAALIMSLHCLIAYRICFVSFGWPAVLFSPGLAWCIPLTTLLLWTHYCHNRRTVQSGKKEQ